MSSRFFWNEQVNAESADQAYDLAPLAFHRSLPGYQPSRLAEAPKLAESLGIAALYVKTETERFGLPAFKILGASWASYRALDAHIGGFAPWTSFDDLKAQLQPHLPLCLVAATDGNHGRAVARMARLLGLDAHIYVPRGIAEARIQAIADEGAEVTIFDGSYDQAVAYSAQAARPHDLVISDTSWEGYETVPRWVIDGYATMFHEIDQTLGERNQAWPDLVFVQMGVGALAAALVQHVQYLPSPQPLVIGVEPLSATALLTSMEAGEIREVPGPHDSIMAGLNCGLPSEIAWPIVSKGITLFGAVDDDWAREAMRALAADDLAVGETGAAGVAGLLALCRDPQYAPLRARLGLGAQSRVLVIATEGITDPEAYSTILAAAPMVHP
jgi:diaminopropionate ammonia-lyase